MRIYVDEEAQTIRLVDGGIYAVSRWMESNLDDHDVLVYETPKPKRYEIERVADSVTYVYAPGRTKIVAQSIRADDAQKIADALNKAEGLE